MGYYLDVLGFMVYLIGREVPVLVSNRMSLGYWRYEFHEEVIFAKSNALSYYLVNFESIVF